MDHLRRGAKTPEKFTVTIDMGNDAMQSLDHVAVALATVRRRLIIGFDEGSIQDENGNTVGKFHVTYEGDEAIPIESKWNSRMAPRPKGGSNA